MRTVLLALGIVLSVGAGAADRTYAVMSLVGDDLLIVNHRESVGTSLERNDRRIVALPDPALDRSTLMAVDAALHRADPSARTILLAGHDTALFEAQERALPGDDVPQAIFDALRSRLPATGATHLLLITKLRAPARMQFAHIHVGSGMVEGLGFYIDRQMVSRRSDTNEKGTGFLAPFAYFTVALVDLASGRVIAEQGVHASTALSTSRSDTLDPWDVLSAADKVRMLQALIRQETAHAVPSLLGRP
jgi:hypothetical protein